MARPGGTAALALLPLWLAGQAAAQQPAGDPYDDLPSADTPEPADATGAEDPTTDASSPAVDDAWLAAAAERVADGDDADTGVETVAAEPPPEVAPPQDPPEIMWGQLTSAGSYTPSPGAKASDGFLPASGVVETGGELALVTSDYRLGNDRVKLTDVGLLRLRVRRALGEHLGLFAATQLLAKQPQSVKEPLWQRRARWGRHPIRALVCRRGRRRRRALARP